MILCVCLCRNVGSRWALEQAKYNLVNEYLLVGVTEELEDFIMMLEAALPRFFRGATELYRTGSLSIFKNYRNSSTTTTKIKTILLSTCLHRSKPKLLFSCNTKANYNSFV